MDFEGAMQRYGFGISGRRYFEITYPPGSNVLGIIREVPFEEWSQYREYLPDSPLLHQFLAVQLMPIGQDWEVFYVMPINARWERFQIEAVKHLVESTDSPPAPLSPESPHKPSAECSHRTD